MAKKLVNSDFKNHRVENPTQIDEKQQKKVKKYCKEYFDKAVAKHRAYEHRKNEKSRPSAADRDLKAAATPNGAGASDDELDVKMSDDEGDTTNNHDNQETSPTATEGGIKRKRTGTATDEDDAMAAATTKRQRSSTPPPPPPPPDGEPPNSDDANLSTPAGTDMERPIDTPPPPPPPPSDDRCMTQEDIPSQVEIRGEV